MTHLFVIHADIFIDAYLIVLKLLIMGAYVRGLLCRRGTRIFYALAFIKWCNLGGRFAGGSLWLIFFYRKIIWAKIITTVVVSIFSFVFQISMGRFFFNGPLDFMHRTYLFFSFQSLSSCLDCHEDNVNCHEG